MNNNNPSDQTDTEPSNIGDNSDCYGTISGGGWAAIFFGILFSLLSSYGMLKGYSFWHYLGGDEESVEVAVFWILVSFFVGCGLTTIPSKEANSCNGTQIHAIIYCVICFIFSLILYKAKIVEDNKDLTKWSIAYLIACVILALVATYS